jgi:hypothetical protein
MLPRRKTIQLSLVLLAVVGLGWLLQTLLEDRGPLYHGRYTADWVADVFGDAKDEESYDAAVEAVVAIGKPAVPFIAKRGLHDPCHAYEFLSYAQLDYFHENHPWLPKWIVRENTCLSTHRVAWMLLERIGPDAHGAIPDLIDCYKRCPEFHFIQSLDVIDLLATISGTNRAAIPFLTELARSDGDENIRATERAYAIDGRTNLFIETCERLARENPSYFVVYMDLDWYRGDDDLNVCIVPLLEHLYADPRLQADDRKIILYHLNERGDAGKAAAARLQARDPSSIDGGAAGPGN